MKKLKIYPPIKIALIYLVLGALWILLSDRVLAFVITDLKQLTLAQTYKGWFFIVSTAILLFVGLIREFSRRQRASEDYLSIFENSVEGFFQSTTYGRFLKVNPAMADMYGYASPEDMVNSVTSIANQIHEDETSRKRFVDQLIKYGHMEGFEARNLRKDGSAFWTLTNARAVKDAEGQVQYFEGFVSDISARKQVEDALHKSSEQFKKIFETNPIASCIATFEECRFLAANEAYWKLTGYTPDEIIGRTSIELGFMDPTKKREIITRLQKEKSIKNSSGKLITNMGEIRDTLEFFDIISFDGQTCILSMFYDVSEQKKAQEALKESEDKYRQLFEAESDAILLIDNSSGKILEANAAASNLYGYTREELLSKKNSDLSAEPEETRRVTQSSQVDHDSIVVIPLRMHRKKNGTVFPVEITGRFFERNGKQVHIAAIRDITDRKNAEEAMQRQLKELTVLHNVAIAASSSTNVDELIRRVTDTVSSMLYPDNCGVELLSPDGKTLMAHPSYRGASEDSVRTPLPVSKGISGKVIMTGNPVRVGDVSQEPAYVEATPGVVSELCVPIRLQNRTIGVFNVESRKVNAFDEADERLLNTIAGTLATSIERLRLFETERQRRKDAEILREATTTLTTSLQLDSLLQTILVNLSKIVPYDSASIAMERDGERRIVACRGFPEGSDIVGRVLKNSGKWTKITSDYRALIVPNVQLDPEFEHWEGSEVIRGWMCISMFKNDNVIGYIFLDSHQPDAFTEKDAILVQTFANSAAVAIENARLFEAEQKNRLQAEILSEATAALTSTIEPERLYEIILNSLSNLIPYDSASIELLDQGYLEIVAYKGDLFSTGLLGKKYEYDVKKWETDEPLSWPIFIADVRKDDRFVKMEGSEYIRAWMGIPMVTQDKLIGFINLDSCTENVYTEEYAALAQTFGNQAAVAIQNARQYQQEQHHFQEAETLRQTAEAITSSLDINQVLDSILNNLRLVVPYDSASLFLAEKDQVILTAAKGLPKNEEAIGLVYPASNALIQHVWKSGQPLILDNAQQDERFEKWAAAELVKGWMGVPLLSHGVPIGCITLDSFKAGTYDDHDAVLAMTFAHQAVAAIENARLFERSEKQIRQLSILRDIDSAISSSFDLRVTLNLLVEYVVKELNVSAAAILTYNPNVQTLSYYTSTGFTNKQAIAQTHLRVGEGLAGKVIMQRKIINYSNLSETPDFKQNRIFQLENFESYYGVPLIGKGQIKGVLEIFHYEPIDPTPDWINFLQTLAGQAAIAIDNVELFMDLQRSNQELTLAYDTTLEGWGKALELRDKETQGHTRRVVDLTIELARQMGIKGDELTNILRGTLLHDIGKMGIPDQILHKPGPLSEEEWAIMRQHPKYAYDLLRPITFLRPAMDIPYGHHERWDGSGYPRGLKGTNIPLAARIFAVVDIWDALLEDRPYRNAWPEEKVIAYLRSEAGVTLDPEIVEKFLGLPAEFRNRNQNQAD